jgi:hypothetical protein
MRTLLTGVVALAALVVGAGTAGAAGGPPLIESVGGDFVMTSAQCPNLPEGTTITGTGSGTSISTFNVDKNGIVTLGNTTHINGTATDELGNTYVYNYSNSYRISNSASDPDTFSGRMVDSFSLAGNGPSHLNNGFTAIFTVGPTVVSIEPLNSHGDPLDFATGTAACDPL